MAIEIQNEIHNRQAGIRNIEELNIKLKFNLYHSKEQENHRLDIVKYIKV